MFESRDSNNTDLHDEVSKNVQRFNIKIPHDYDDFICPISLLMMAEPVIINCDHIFESTSIQEWKEKKEKNHSNENCPLCRKPITEIKPALEHKIKIHNGIKNIALYLKNLKPKDYTLVIMTEDLKPEAGKIYIRIKGNDLEYAVKSPFNSEYIYQLITQEEMTELFIIMKDDSHPFFKAIKDNNYKKLNTYLTHILNITSSRGHTLSFEFDRLRKNLINSINKFITAGNHYGFLKAKITKNIKEGNFGMASQEVSETSSNACTIA